MMRTTWLSLAVILFGNANSIAQTPEEIEEVIGGGGRLSYSFAGAQSLGLLIGRAEQIVVWQIKEIGPDHRLVCLRQIQSLKERQLPAGAAPIGPEILFLLGKVPSWVEPGRDAVVFIRNGKAAVCTGTNWHELAFDGVQSRWHAVASENPYLSNLYSGTTDVLKRQVQAILAGREVVVTAAKLDLDRPVSDNIHRIWRIKASLKIDSLPRTIRSPLYVGWGAGEREELPRMIAELTHPQWWRRSLAIREIASLGEKAKVAVPELWKRFCDERPLIRIQAAEAILRIDPENELPLLAVVLELRSREESVRDEAVQVLRRWKRFSGSLLPWLIASFERELAPFSVQLLDLIGELALSTDVELKRQLAVTIARKIRAANSVVFVENSLARLLAELSDEAAGPMPARRILPIRADDHDSTFHEVAVRTLISLGPECEPAFPTLRLMVRADASGSALAAAALAKFAPDGPDWLAKQLGTPLPVNKQNIISGLREAPERMHVAIPNLRKLLNDKDYSLRIDAACALFEIDMEAEGYRAAKALLKIAENEESRQRHFALAYLGMHKLLEPSYRTVESRRFERYLLMRDLRKPVAPRRTQALQRLQDMGAEAAEVVPELWRMLESENADLRLDLIRAIAAIDVPVERGQFVRDSRRRLAEKLRAMFHERSHQLHDLICTSISLGPDAVHLLAELSCCLGHADINIREGAMRALGAIGPEAKNAILDLITMTEEDNRMLQEGAIVALLRVSPGHKLGVQRLREWCQTEDLHILRYLVPADLGNEMITPILLEAIESDQWYLSNDAFELLRATDPEAARKLKRTPRVLEQLNHLRPI